MPQLEGGRLHAGSRARVAGHLAGRRVEFEVVVLDASEQQLALVARGPISLRVQYLLRPAHGGSEVDASMSIEGHGLFGRLLAKATEALLAAGALHSSLERLGRELEPARRRNANVNTGDLADATTRSCQHARHRHFCPLKSN